MSDQPQPSQEYRRLARRGYWARWAYGALLLIAVVQAELALGACVWFPVLLPFAVIDAAVTLGAAVIAIIYSPALIDPPYEERLRMEEWVAVARTPEPPDPTEP